MRKFLVLSVCACLTACATSSEYEMSEETAARLAEFERTGEMDSCLSVSSLSQLTALDEKHLLARVGAGQYYLNEVSGNCSGAGRFGNRLQYTVHGGSQLCKNEIINVVDNSGGFFMSSCSLNEFERLEKIPAD